MVLEQLGLLQVLSPLLGHHLGKLHVHRLPLPLQLLFPHRLLLQLVAPRALDGVVPVLGQSLRLLEHFLLALPLLFVRVLFILLLVQVAVYALQIVLGDHQDFVQVGLLVFAVWRDGRQTWDCGNSDRFTKKLILYFIPVVLNFNTGY